MKFDGLQSARRVWAWLALMVLLLLLLIPLDRPDEGGVLGENLRNLMHVPLFASVTFLLRFLQLSSRLRPRSLLACGLAALLLAALSEIAQGSTGRTPSAEDLGADLGGILLACMILLRGPGPNTVIVRLMLLLAGCGMLALAVRPLCVEVFAERAKREAFPALVDLGHPNGLWQSQGGTILQVVERENRSGGRGGIQVWMLGGSYEGLRHTIPKGVDTHGYSGLRIETVNPGEAFELGVRIDGRGQERRYASLVVPAGKAVVETQWAPRPGNGGLVRVVLFTGEDQPARGFLLLDARLVRANR